MSPALLKQFVITTNLTAKLRLHAAALSLFQIPKNYRNKVA
jgi:hypothetical protein